MVNQVTLAGLYMVANRYGYKQVTPLGLKIEAHFSGKELTPKGCFLDSPGFISKPYQLKGGINLSNAPGLFFLNKEGLTIAYYYSMIFGLRNNAGHSPPHLNHREIYLMITLRAAVFVIMLGLLLPGQVWAQDVLTLSGATTIQPVAEQIGQLYNQRYGRTVHVTGGGSGAGIKNAQTGESDLGMVSRSLRENEKNDLSYLTAGFDAVVLMGCNTKKLYHIVRDRYFAICYIIKYMNNHF